MVERVLSSVKKETDRQYFFLRLNNPLWIEPLRVRGYFNNPPAANPLPNGYVQYPYWPELAYLVTVAADAEDKVTEVVLALPKTDNPRVYDAILSVALKLPRKSSAKLLPKLVEYTELENQLLAHRYPELLQYWIAEGNVSEAIEIVKRLIPFKEDPRAQEKQQLRKGNSNALGTLLEPTPQFGQWEYKQILDKGVRLLSEKEPFQISDILINAVADLIRMRTHQAELDKQRDEDLSDIWCRRLNHPDHNSLDSQELLVNALTYACEQVYQNAPESIDVLDKALRKHRWKLFKRLRQQLYSSHPNDQTLPWIREFILEHDDYSKWEHHYEFQLMTRKACEQFGYRLLSEAERTTIFNAILGGPSKENFRKWMGDRYTEETFQQRQHYFHRMQLRPFALLLDGENRHYFDELEREQEAKVITDESYSPYSGVSGGFVSSQSPKSAEDLQKLSDGELLTYLNEWDEEHRDRDNWLVEINISALAGVFQSLFKEKIVPDSERLQFWIAHRDEIARPVYVASIIKVMQDIVQKKDFGKLNQWIEFCAWVLIHSDSRRVEGQPELRDDSRSHPDWGTSRRAVVDFIDTCVSKDTDAPTSFRDGLANLLRQLCTQFDWRLDCDRPVFLNRDDPVTEAINNTRSRAILSLVNFGFWIRRYLHNDPVPEVATILSQRMAEGATFPLTGPEHALLGMQFGNLCVLSKDWADSHQAAIFPQQNAQVWQAAFSSYLRFNQPFKPMFEILRGNFEYALENLNALASPKDTDDGVDRLAQHVFTYYLWEAYPLTGGNSLLERFYAKTDEQRGYWARLFDNVGRSLVNSGKQLEKSLTDRVVAYFDWRFLTAEPVELKEFTFWLEAECLDAEWRLRSFSKILDLRAEKKLGLSLDVKFLNGLLPDHLPLVVECFAKITDIMGQDTQLYILPDNAKPILKAGLNAEDLRTRKNAERARENLLQLGRFDYLDVER